MRGVAKEWLTIGEVSRRTGIPVKTLRDRSDEGLLPPSERSRSGYRLYSERDVIRLDLIRALREAGLGLTRQGDEAPYSRKLRYSCKSMVSRTSSSP